MPTHFNLPRYPFPRENKRVKTSVSPEPLMQDTSRRHLCKRSQITGNTFVKDQIFRMKPSQSPAKLIRGRNHQLLGSAWNTKRRDRTRSFFPFRGERKRVRFTIGGDAPIKTTRKTIRRARKNKEYRSEATPSQSACSNTPRGHTKDTFTTERCCYR